MKKLLIIASIVAFAGCAKVEPIEVVAPERPIDTKAMEQYKSNLEQRKVAIGMIYGWGKLDKSNLMHTPDSLDVVVVKDGYEAMNEYQKADLSNTQTKKLTKVLVGFDLQTRALNFEKKLDEEIKARQKEKGQELKNGNEFLTDAELKIEMNKVAEVVTTAMNKTETDMLDTLTKRAVEVMQQQKFNGISVEVPQNFNTAYTKEKVKATLMEIAKTAGKGKDYLFMVENAFQQAADAVKQANWVVYREVGGTPRFASFDNASERWRESRFVPSVDFSREDIAAGFADSETFSPSGKLPITLDIINWKAPNIGGVAYYHIEKNYNDMSGKITYHTLRYTIGKLQTIK